VWFVSRDHIEFLFGSILVGLRQALGLATVFSIAMIRSPK